MKLNPSDALARYIEFAKPYKLIISSGFPGIYPILALKIEHKGEWYGNYVLLKNVEDEDAIKKAINYLKEEIGKNLP